MAQDARSNRGYMPRMALATMLALILLAMGALPGAAQSELTGAAQSELTGAAQSELTGAAQSELTGAAQSELTGAAQSELTGAAQSELTGAAQSELTSWRGGIDLYRSGVFSTQKTWYWCTAADVQIMRNIVHHKTNHRKAQQRRFFRYMRAHNRYAIPVRHGVDPVGWAAGLRRFVDPRYRLVTRGTFKRALRSAVRNLRLTNLPVGITVARGNHAWVLTGFTATADPARTNRFKVTSVRVTGPLWGIQSRSFGYDMRPDKRLTRKQLKGFFTAWHYPGVRMSWEGRWVSVQPIP